MAFELLEDRHLLSSMPLGSDAAVMPVALEPASAATLAITEINYNPYAPTQAEIAAGYTDGKSFEFVELKNIGTAPIDLDGVQFTRGITFDFGTSAITSLDPGQVVVVVSNPFAFALRYSEPVAVAGAFGGSLDNSGERITLADSLGVAIRDFTYSDDAPWPTRADGLGSSLEIVDPSAIAGDAANWRASAYYGGLPGIVADAVPRDVVVNEVLAAPGALQTDAIELYNTTAAPVSIAGWYLSDSGNRLTAYRVDAGDPRAIIPAHGFVVFTEADFNSSGGVNDFALSAGGDEVWLTAAAPNGAPLRFADQLAFGSSVVDISYGRLPDGGDRFELLAYPTLGTANSHALVGAIVINEIHSNPDIDTELVEFIELYNAGSSAVNLSGWHFSSGITFTFPAHTPPMQPGQYIVLAQNPAAFFAKFGVQAFGQFTGALANEGERVVLRDSHGVLQDEVDYTLGFPWPTVGDAPGQSMELINPSFDNNLAGNWRSSYYCTPGRANSRWSTNVGPQIRDVTQSVQQPASGEDMVITARITDPHGIFSVHLRYQIVLPGDYISMSDARYGTQWTSIAMRDDGLAGDQYAGDGVYTVVLDGAIQQHRRLIRYKISALDGIGASVLVPYTDDPQPNFAYFVYDEMPSWTGQVNAESPPVTYSSELLESVPVYHLLTTRENHVNSQYVPYRVGQPGQVLPSTGAYRGSDYLWQGALVYDGVVYDHISYRARGGVWRYAMGKNMWKFDFNRGHSFQAYDNDGNPLGTTVDKINLGAIIQQGDYRHRGEQGLFESVGFKLFDLAGVESPKTHYIHFRIVAGANEQGADQYSGDFQGVYLFVEQMDGRWLDEHGLPDGNLYKMESGTGELNNQGPTQPSNKSDLNAFISGYATGPGEQWWRDNLDVERYFSYRAIVEAIHHYDIAGGKNYFYYHNPETGLWSVHPWDLDLTWANNMYGDGNEPFKQAGILNIPSLAQEYRNRMREVIDLLYNPEQVAWMLQEESRFVYTPGSPSLVDADRAMWDYNPILTSSYASSGKAGHGRFYAGGSGTTIPAPGGFPGMMQLMQNYVVSRSSWIASTILTDELSVPLRPTVSFIGNPQYPVDDLRFQTNPFASTSGGQFAAMEWRVAAVTDPNSPTFDPASERKYEMTSTWESGELTSFNNSIALPGAELQPGETYRVRVRMKDHLGRWSHWSAPVQFTATAADTLTDSLRITEIMYNPPSPTSAELTAGFTDSKDFEFVELRNISDTETLDLTGVRFTAGIEFDFTDADVTLAPGQYVLLVSNQDAFQFRYGTSLPVVGTFTGNLANGGEQIQLQDPWGETIVNFIYDASEWPSRADGVGSSLEVIDPAGNYSSAANWRASAEYGGSPAAAGIGPIATIVINEVLTHTDLPEVDAIELMNLTGQPINIGGWFLSDSGSDLWQYQFPTDQSAWTTIAAGGYLVIEETAFLFRLSSLGEKVWLVSADATGKPLNFVDVVEFPAAANGESFGRWPNGSGILYPMITTTLGQPNSGPRVGPVVISEIMYAPMAPTAAELALCPTMVAADFEFLEIYNPLNASVDLTEWRIRAGIDYDFVAGTTLAPRGTIVVLPFDPRVSADMWAAFSTRYFGSVIAVPSNFFGAYSGSLNNGGEMVRLLRPDTPQLDDPTIIPRLLVDEVDYRPTSPWPTLPLDADGALVRLDPTLWGHDAASWTMAAPLPGATAYTPDAATVASRRIFYNDSAFDGNGTAVGTADYAAIATDKTALLPGELATLANYISYVKGINGIVIDVAGLWSTELQATGSATTSSFEFRIGNDDSPDGWRSSFDTQNAVPLPEVFVHAGQGVDGADRVLLVWANGALPNHHWLQVRVVANSATGLEHDDVFYFGLAIGDTGADNAGTRVLVNVADAMGARKNPVALPDLASIDNLYDFDRDRDVDQNDQLIARNHPALFSQGLALISPPTLPQPTAPQPTAPSLSPAAELVESPLWANPSVVDAVEVEPEVWTAPSAAVVEPTASRDATHMRAALAYLFDQWETERRTDADHDWFEPERGGSTSPTLLRWQPAGRTFFKR